VLSPERTLANQIVTDLRTEIVRADTKASMLIAAMGIGLGAPLGGSRFDPAGCASDTACGSSWLVACLLWLAALGCLLTSLTPRYRRSSWSNGAPMMSFADVHRAAVAGRLPDALRSTGVEEHASLLATAAELSGIVVLKYRWTRASLVCFGLGIPAIALSMMTS
jgi:hypothetical protein